MDIKRTLRDKGTILATRVTRWENCLIMLNETPLGWREKGW
jgi:hypothetical protein